jgi:hypothetical protein
MNEFGKWKSHNGGEMPAKLIARMVQIQCRDQSRDFVEIGNATRCADDLTWSHDAPCAYPIIAYRIVKKPKAQKVETVSAGHIVCLGKGNRPLVINATESHPNHLANITHTYTITDGRVTACDTIIHD